MTLPWYCTREDVKQALDFKETARNDRQIDRAIEGASRSVERQMHRRFYPETDTRFFDWPNEQHARSWRLWLDQHELISVTTLTAGGTAISALDYFLEPNGSGPPYSRIEIDLSSSAAFSAGATHQRAIAITGVFGYTDDQATAGTAAEAVDTSETAVDVSDSAAVGVGDLIKIDSERMVVTGKTMLDTGQNCTTLTASMADQSITSVTAGSIAVGETLLVDSERMLVVDVAGTTLTVKRAWDGTTLAAHTNGADIYAPRTLTVTRGALGTTAASHLTSATIYRHVVPPLIRQLTLAEAVSSIQHETRGYARTAASNEIKREIVQSGLADLRDRAIANHGRKARKRAV